MLTPLLNPLFTGAIETALNRMLYRDRALNNARQRLTGKVLGVFVNEINSPLYLVFSDNRLDVLGAWEGDTECCVKTRLSVLPELRDRQQLTALIRSGELVVEGDIQVVQQFIGLMDLAEWDPAELLAPYTGDVVAQGMSMFIRKGAHFVVTGSQRQRQYIGQAVTEEWHLAPGVLEAAWFSEEVDAVSHQLESLETRLSLLEDKI